jgi:hypothetical protein
VGFDPIGKNVVVGEVSMEKSNDKTKERFKWFLPFFFKSDLQILATLLIIYGILTFSATNGEAFVCLVIGVIIHVGIGLTLLKSDEK